MFKSLKIHFKFCWPLLFVTIAIGFNLILLFPETGIRADLNDSVFALSLISRLNLVLSEITQGGLQISKLPLLLDNWVPEFNMGFPVFSYYQHLPHLTIVFLYRLFLILNSHFLIFDIFNWFKYLMLCLYPLAIYVSARKFGLSKIASGVSSLISTLISTQYLYGTDYNSLVFRGSGMYTQLWGMFFLPLAVSHIYDSVINSRGYIKAVVFLALSFSGHLIFGYMALLSTPIIIIATIFNNFSINNLTKYLKRLFLILTSCFLLLSYWFIPLFLNASYQNRSLWDDQTKFNSFGAIQIIKWLVNGQLFDNNRFPVLTITVAMGFFYALYKFISTSNEVTGGPDNFFSFAFASEKENMNKETSISREYSGTKKIDGPLRQIYLFLPLLFLFWLILYFGRYTFGGLFDLLPMSEGIHGHRFVNGIHFAGIFLVGLSAEWFYLLLGSKLNLLFKKIGAQFFISKTLLILNSLFLILILIFFLPAFKERSEYLDYNSYSIRYHTDLYNKDAPDFQQAMDKIKSLGGGRINIGRPGNWGRNFGPGPFSGYFGASINNVSTVGFAPESWSPNTDIDQFFSEYDPAYYNVFNVKYIVAPVSEKFPVDAAKFAKKIGTYGKFLVYEVNTTGLTQNRLGYFEFINLDTIIYAQKNYRFNLDRLWLGSQLMPKQNHPLVTYDKNFASAYPNVFTMVSLSDYKIGQPWERNELLNLFGVNPFETKNTVLKYNLEKTPGKILREKNNDNFYAAQVETPKDSVLMLKVSYHPFWSVKIDGKKAEKFSVMPLYLAVKVPAGTHLVEFTYFPAWYKVGLMFVSLLTLPGLFFFLKKYL